MRLRLIRFLYLGARRFLLGTGISFIPPFSWMKQAALRSLRGSSRVPVLGSMFRLDPGDRLNLGVNGVYEPEDTALVKRVLKPGQTVVDVGANIGYYTCYMSRLVGENGYVLAFEPAPDLFAILQDNVQYNRCDNVVLYQKAVTSQRGPVTLYMEEGRPEDNRIFPDETSKRRKCAVQGVCLDDIEFLEEHPPDFIKMDIQGAEMLALQGMRSLLKRAPQACMLVEFWPYGLERAGHDPIELIRMLEELGLCVFACDDRAVWKPLSREQVPDLCGVGVGLYVNVLAGWPDHMSTVIRDIERV